MSATPNTSIRLNADERALLEAYARYMSAKHGVNLNRTQAIKTMMRRCKPPEGELGPEAVEFRRRYSAVFGRGGVAESPTSHLPNKET